MYIQLSQFLSRVKSWKSKMNSNLFLSSCCTFVPPCERIIHSYSRWNLRHTLRSSHTQAGCPVGAAAPTWMHRSRSTQTKRWHVKSFVFLTFHLPLPLRDTTTMNASSRRISWPTTTTPMSPLRTLACTSASVKWAKAKEATGSHPKWPWHTSFPEYELWCENARQCRLKWRAPTDILCCPFYSERCCKLRRSLKTRVNGVRLTDCELKYTKLSTWIYLKTTRYSDKSWSSSWWINSIVLTPFLNMSMYNEYQSEFLRRRTKSWRSWIALWKASLTLNVWTVWCNWKFPSLCS